MALTVGSLFAGIGGIDLGLERAGMVTRWFVEWDAHCQNVLRRHWPGLPVYGDITTVDWSTVEPVDVLAGGFPCQPVSNAGYRRGTEDERWLWPEFERAISFLRPRYVLVENVAALRHRGLGIVLSGLAALGYDAEWDCIPASSVGAPHIRDRLWLVAYPSQRADLRRFAQSDQRTLAGGDAQGDVADSDARRRDGGPGQQRESRRAEPENGGGVAHTDSEWQSQPQGLEPNVRRWTGDSSRPMADADRGDAQRQQPQRHDQADRSQSAERSAGLFGGARPSGEWPAEPRVGRVAHGVPHRVDRLRALGNAVVPQVVEWIGRRIVAFDEGEELAA